MNLVANKTILIEVNENMKQHNKFMNKKNAQTLAGENLEKIIETNKEAK